MPKWFYWIMCLPGSPMCLVEHGFHVCLPLIGNLRIWKLSQGHRYGQDSFTRHNTMNDLCSSPLWSNIRLVFWAEILFWCIRNMYTCSSLWIAALNRIAVYACTTVSKSLELNNLMSIPAMLRYLFLAFTWRREFRGLLRGIAVPWPNWSVFDFWMRNSRAYW